MNTITKRILIFILGLFLFVLLLPQNIDRASAATNVTVYEYSPMLEDRGDIYYIQTVGGDESSYDIYRLDVATGKTTRLISSKKDILGMMLYNDTLYYTSYDGEKDVYQIYSVSIEGKDKKTICNGFLLFIDDNSIYYTVTKNDESKLYKKDHDNKKATLIYTGNNNFGFVKNLDNTLYFTQFNEVSSKLTLFTLMQGQTKLDVLITDKITRDGTERTYPAVSDVVKINGDIYYQYGTYQGTGNYWYGTLNKLNSHTKIKSTIVKQLYEEQIYHNESSIFYNGTDSSEKHYQYNTKTGETSTYTYKTTGTETFNILGDKTYCAKADGKVLIIVSCFTSGTNKKNLVKAFINIPYKQKKNLDYSARVKKYGDYLLIPVTCMDFNDASHGWRGKCVSITWYVADTDGNILTHFQ